MCYIDGQKNKYSVISGIMPVSACSSACVRDMFHWPLS
jgi:hypothetical protein